MLSHTITWGVNLAVLTNLTQYVWHQQMKKTWKRGHWERFGPVYLCALSVPLVMYVRAGPGIRTARLGEAPARR